MRSGTLLTQVLLVNLLLIAAAVVAAVDRTQAPRASCATREAAGLVLGFAIAATVLVNVFLLSRRVAPLERLADEMEQTDLSGPTRTDARSDRRARGDPAPRPGVPRDARPARGRAPCAARARRSKRRSASAPAWRGTSTTRSTRR